MKKRQETPETLPNISQPEIVEQKQIKILKKIYR